MSNWPQLHYNDWKATYETLHRWLQIAGKVRLSRTPWTNHSWHSTLFLSARGLTTGPIPILNRIATIDFDFIDHKVIFQDSEGRSYYMALMSESVASFYARFLKALEYMQIKAEFDPHPNECMDYISFAEDIVHDTYIPAEAHRCFQVLTRVSNVLQYFRSLYVGKCSPVHFFWGSFDLAVTRFSGRLAPEHPGLAPHISPYVMKEAYSHEVSSCGFWPGNEAYPHPAFYSYCYPVPEAFPGKVKLKGSFYHPDLSEYILPYEVVQNSADPETLLLDFFQQTYKAAAESGDWDRERLEESPFLKHCQAKHAWQGIPAQKENRISH